MAVPFCDCFSRRCRLYWVAVMGMIVYIDSVFALNALLDGLLLYFTGYLAGVERKLCRLVAAAFLGGGYAALAFFPAGTVAVLPPVRIGFGAVLLWAAYGKQERFGRLCLLFFGLSCALAGAVIAAGALVRLDLYRQGAYLLPVRFPVLLAAACGSFGVLWLFGRGTWHHRVEGTLVEADCEIGGKAVRLRVLRDTGNTLRDGMTGAPVLVVEGARLLPLWPEAVQKCLAEGLAHPAEVLTAVERCPGAPRFRLLPFRSVGTAEGLLLSCTAQRATIGRYCAPVRTVALSPTPVSERREYDALWGGPVK